MYLVTVCACHIEIKGYLLTYLLDCGAGKCDASKYAQPKVVSFKVKQRKLWVKIYLKF